MLFRSKTIYSRDSFIGTLETRLSRRSIVPLTPTIENPRDASTYCDATAVTAVDSRDQSNASPQTPLPRPDKRVPTVYILGYFYPIIYFILFITFFQLCYLIFNTRKVATHCKEQKNHGNWLKNKKVIQSQKNAQKTQNFQFKNT